MGLRDGEVSTWGMWKTAMYVCLLTWMTRAGTGLAAAQLGASGPRRERKWCLISHVRACYWRVLARLTFSLIVEYFVPVRRFNHFLSSNTTRPSFQIWRKELSVVPLRDKSWTVIWGSSTQSCLKILPGRSKRWSSSINVSWNAKYSDRPVMTFYGKSCPF